MSQFRDPDARGSGPRDVIPDLVACQWDRGWIALCQDKSDHAFAPKSWFWTRITPQAHCWAPIHESVRSNLTSRVDSAPSGARNLFRSGLHMEPPSAWGIIVVTWASSGINSALL